jgi:signal transduction histidine kinase
LTRLLTILFLLFPYPLVFAQGEKYEEQGYLAKALEAYRNDKDLNGIASILTATGKYDSVTFYLDQSRSADSSPANLVKVYLVEARYLQSKNEYDLALKSLQKAKDIAVDKRDQAIILANIGTIHFSHNSDKSVARDYFLQSNALLDSSIHYNILARNYARLANVAMTANDSIAAKVNLDRAKKISDLSDNLPVKAYVLSSYAILLFEAGKIPEGIKLQQQSIDIKRELGQLRSLQNDLLNISESYTAMKMYKEADAVVAEGKSISKSLNDLVYLKYFYEVSSALDSLRGDYKSAYTNYKIAMIYKDSTFSSQHLRDVKEIQEKYESEQKEKIIAEKELQIAIILGVSLMVILIMVVRRARNKRQQNRLRLQTIVKTQEEVQQRIARDLHDGLVQTLGAAKMSLQAIGPGTEKDVVQRQVRNASEIIDEAVNEARSISHEILPYSLLKDGLVLALEELFARSLTSYKFDVEGEIKPDEQATINFYRIVQELVNNSQKHVPSAHVTIRLENGMNDVRLIFSDTGPGFNRDVTKGAGLHNINARAEAMNGSIIITSAPEAGTTIKVTFPK